MASVITIAGEKLFAAKAQANEQLDIDTFIFANVPGQDATDPINREEGLPTDHVVHQQIVQQVGRINDNVVVYSTVLDSITGPFEFNWVGLYSSINNTLVAINHIPTTPKTKTEAGVAGNTLNRNFGIEYSGIADLTGIDVAPETWQLDFTARLSGMDKLTQQLAADMNGKDWFIEDGFKVEPRSTVNSFKILPGIGYVSGLRVELENEHIFTVENYPQFIYVDAWFEGDADSTWSPSLLFTISDTELDDYTDGVGIKHYVNKLAEVTSFNDIVDLRPDSESANKDWVEKEAKVTANETTNPRNLPDRFAHEIDVRDFGAHDLAQNNALQFQAAFDKARELNKPVKAKGRFILKDALLYLYTDADFSGATFVIDKAAIKVFDRRDESEFVQTLSEEDIIEKHLMTDGRGSLRGIVPDEILKEFENSFVWVTSDTSHQYRINGSDVTEYKQGSVSVLRRHGQLDYTLTHDYTQSSNVRIELRKMPKSKLILKCPEIEIIRLGYSYVWTIRRSLTNVESPSIMTKQSEMAIDDGYRALINIDGCANVKINDMDTAGLGEPSGIEGVSSIVRYDLIFGRVAGLTINNPNCGTGWKSIDGNYARGISVRGGTIAGIHGHFGVADVTVDDVTITCAAFSFGTGANDSTIRLSNIRYQGTHSKLFALRSDFSELRGRVIIDGIDVNADKIGEATFDIVSFYESAVKNSGGNNPTQPRTLYLPRSIECRNIAINHKHHVRLIDLPDYDYGADKQLKMPRRIKFSDIDIENVSGRTEFFFNARPFDRDSSQPVILDLKDFIQPRKEKPILLSVGRIDREDGVPYDLRLNNVEVTTNFYDEKSGYIGGNYRSRIIAKNTRIYRGWDMYDGNLGSGKVMYIEWDSCTYNPLDAVGEAQLSFGQGIGIAKVINCTFNGSDLLVKEGRLAKIAQLVNGQGNNTFIDYDTTDSINNDHKWGQVNSLGKMYLQGSALGHKGNYTRNEDGSLMPTWPTERDIMMLGMRWLWFDDTGSFRVHDNYPSDFNNDGKMVQLV